MPRTYLKLAAVVVVTGIAAAACGSVKMGAAAIVGNERISTATLNGEVANFNSYYQKNSGQVQQARQGCGDTCGSVDVERDVVAVHPGDGHGARLDAGGPRDVAQQCAEQLCEGLLAGAGDGKQVFDRRLPGDGQCRGLGVESEGSEQRHHPGIGPRVGAQFQCRVAKAAGQFDVQRGSGHDREATPPNSYSNTGAAI